MHKDRAEAAALIEQAASAGVHLWVEGNRLRFRSQSGDLPDSLKRSLRDYRTGVIEELRRKAAATFTEGPLAANQHGLWFLNRLAPDSAAYNVAFSARIHGELNLDLFAEAVQILVDRHEALRTVYPRDTGEPVRRVLGHLPIEIDVQDARDWPPAQLNEALREAYRQPFDLGSGPLIRATLFSEAVDRSVLLLSAHHIAVDGTSMFALIEELGNLYGALVNGEPVPRRESAEFSEFVTWQHDMLTRMDRERRYWQNVLEPPPPPLDLPRRLPRQRTPRLEGRTHREIIDSSTTAELRAFARNEGVTDYVLLLSLWFAFLHRLTKSSDITVGTPVQGRPSARFERTIGDFVNTLPLRVRQIKSLTARDLLKNVRTHVLAALEHQDLPLPLMLQQPVNGDAAGTPFDTLFVLQDFTHLPTVERLMVQGDTAPVQVGGLSLSRILIDQQEGQFDLALEVLPCGNELQCAWRYDDEQFDPVWIASWSRSFATFAAAAARWPNRSINELPLIDPISTTRLAQWNATDRAYRTDMTLVDLLVEQAERTPDAIAVSAPDSGVVKQLTYEELHARSNALATHLQSLGVSRDVPVAVLMERSAEMVVALLAVLKAGGAYVPVDPGYPAERRAFMLSDCGAPVVLTQARFLPLVSAAGMHVLAVDHIWSELTDGKEPRGEAAPDSLAYIIYTSGSTGKPKGAMIEHRSIVNRLIWMQEHFGLDRTDVFLQKTPFSFDVSVWEFFWPLMIGSRLVMARPEGHKDPKYLSKLIAQEGVTTVHFVPSMLAVFLETVQQHVLPSLKHVICSGEALSGTVRDRVFERLPHVALTNLYGPTEAAVDVSWWSCSPDEGTTTVPIGWPVANTRLYILDEHMQPVPIGVPGELYIAGIQVGRGYLNRPDLTRERFLESPFVPGERMYRTGDLARHLPNGAIDFLGRLDFQVKVRGFRIELGEIEARLREHPAVKDTVVVARDERLVAYVVTSEGVLPVEELRGWLSETLPDYMVPAVFMALDALPVTPNGKVDRKALPEARPSPASERIGRHPATATEIELAAIWSELLGVEEPSLEDSFFEVGGNSLTAARMIHAIRQRLGTDLPVRAVFDAPRLGELAARVEEYKSSDGAGEVLEVIEF